MIDITNKNNTLREATAEAVVRVSKKETVEAIINKTVPKGDVFEMSRAAGLLGVKKTPEILPDCHPLPIEYAGFQYEIDGLDIKVLCTLKTIYKTGIEVEAMHGASIVALNLYDMLKPIDKGIEIHHIKLRSKKGGKTDVHQVKAVVNAAVVVCSDSISTGEKEDVAGKTIVEALKKWQVSVINCLTIPDEVTAIQAQAKKHQQEGISLIIFTGGTGLSPRDQTPEALKPLLDRSIPGMEEAMRSYGQNRKAYAMLSRSLAGMMGNSLVLALPGSTKGATESLQAIFPAALHIFDIIEGAQHST